MGRFALLVIVALTLVACPSSVIATKVIPIKSTPHEPGFIPSTGGNAFTGCGGTLVSEVNTDFEQAVIEQTNQIRMDAGLTPLKKVEELTLSARYHAADMSRNNYFSHNTFDRRADQVTEICDTWHRIESFYPNWLALAENIAAGQRVPEMAMDGWMNSPDHRHNIMSENYMEIGVGFFQGEGDYRFYWVQNFGTMDGRFPLIINGERATTASNQVKLYIYGDWERVRLRSDSGEWSQWMPFSHELEWTLPEEPGLHTVTAELRNGSRQYQTSDEIRLAP